MLFRSLRSNKGISPKEAVPVVIKTMNQARFESLAGLLKKLANVSDVSYTTDKAAGTPAAGTPAAGTSFVIKGDEFFVQFDEELDVEAEIENLTKELTYSEGFKKSVEAKLSNERFVANAKPEVVENERNKLADAEAKIAALNEALKRLRG